MPDLLPPRGPLEFRWAELGDVDDGKRLIEMVAVPYGELAVVEHRGRMVRERVERGAFAGLERRPGRVPVYRDHDRGQVVGRATEFHEGSSGLFATAKIVEGPLGDETLDLARIGALGASVGMRVDLLREKVTPKTRVITKAWLDHVALVPNPAYKGAVVVSVSN